MNIYDQLMTADPDQLAELAHAAACWQTLMNSPYGAEIREELSAWQRRSTISEWSSAVAVMAAGHDFGPSHDELVERRKQVGEMCVAFTTRHGGPYRGGPVDWATGRPLSRAGHASIVRAA